LEKVLDGDRPGEPHVVRPPCLRGGRKRVKIQDHPNSSCSFHSEQAAQYDRPVLVGPGFNGPIEDVDQVRLPRFTLRTGCFFGAQQNLIYRSCPINRVRSPSKIWAAFRWLFIDHREMPIFSTCMHDLCTPAKIPFLQKAQTCSPDDLFVV